jgi:pimeloyl-ACP methyl ester carboxylesterase
MDSLPAAPDAVAPAERQALVFGQHIRYLEAGAGPPVVLVHGLGDDAGVWQAEIAPLARRYHVIALDQIGFGRSDKPLLNYRAQTLVDFLDEFMRTLGIGRATVVGNSLGGWVAALLASEHPERVDRLVLVDAAGLSGLPEFLGPRLMRALRLATIDDLKVLGARSFADPRDFESAEALRAAFAERVAAGDGYTIGRIMDSLERREDLLDARLAGISAPTLIVWGRQDGLVPPRFGERLHTAIRGSKLVTLDRCGHEPQLECAEAFEAALEAFLGR